MYSFDVETVADTAERLETPFRKLETLVIAEYVYVRTVHQRQTEAKRALRGGLFC